jgi:hypothetical protein
MLWNSMMHFFRDINIKYNIFFILRQTSKEFDSSKCFAANKCRYRYLTFIVHFYFIANIYRYYFNFL